MIAVIGATGNTGRAVVKELRSLGQEPVSIVRNADKARDVLGAEAKTAVAELTDRAALEKALAGVKTVFVVTGHNPQMVEQQVAIMEAAKKVGAENYIKVSGGRAVVTPDSETFVGRGHHQIEDALRSSGLKWVILRPGLFFQNTFAQAPQIKADGKFITPFAKDLPLALIDVRDTGALGARVSIDPGKHAGQTIEFSGKLTNYGELANVFQEVLGKPITYIQATLEQAEAAMKSRNMPDWLIGHLLAIARIAARGGFSTENVQPIRDIVGREPITAKKFVEDHKGMFA